MEPLSTRRFWVVRDSYHTAIIVAAEELLPWASQLGGVLGDQLYVRFGWGDRDYYGSSKKNLWKLFKALFLPTRSVMEVTQFDSVVDGGQWIVELTTEREKLQRMLANIVEYFFLTENNKPECVRTEKSEGEGSARNYYRARGIYYIFKNCNNWTAQMLKQGGVEIRYFVSLLSKKLMQKLEEKPGAKCVKK